MSAHTATQTVPREAPVMMTGASSSSAFTSLERLETSPLSPVSGTRSQARLHARHATERRHIIWSLEASPDLSLQRRSNRIRECCAHPVLCVREDGRPYVSLQCCRDRLCPHCQRGRGQRLTASVLSITRRMDAPRFLTLTLTHRDESLTSMLDRLAKAFRDLRKRPEWNRHVRGGCYAIEVTHGLTDSRWHAHLHVLIDGTFWEQKAISKVWRAVTGDSMIVDIRSVPDRRSTARYISAYVAKPADLSKWPPERVCEFASAMHGRRLIHTFGNAHNQPIDDEPEAPPPKITEPVVSLTRICRYADAGDPRALYVQDILQRMGPREAAAVGLLPFPSSSPPPPLQDWELSLCMECAREIAAAEPDVAAPLPIPPPLPPPMAEVLTPSLFPEFGDAHGRVL